MRSWVVGWIGSRIWAGSASLELEVMNNARKESWDRLSG